MKRIFCGVMALICLFGLLGLFAGCGEKNEEEQAPPLPIIENGVSNHIIVYPATPSAAETEAVNVIKEKINDVTGVRVKSVSEEFVEAEDASAMIYVGNTTFEPAVAAKEKISDKLTMEQVRKIAEIKKPDVNATDIESIESMVKGTARSMGVTVEE